MLGFHRFSFELLEKQLPFLTSRLSGELGKETRIVTRNPASPSACQLKHNFEAFLANDSGCSEWDHSAESWKEIPSCDEEE